ncbi:MAG: SGNH/GDSL hydrolase family protein [Opitutaceae bacterium]
MSARSKPCSPPTYPDSAIRIVNQGLSGNTVRDLQTRWRQDVLDLRPDWLSIMIGINDAWRLFDMPLQSELHVPPDEYEERLEELVASTRPKLDGMILMSPYVIEPNRAEPMRALMDRYGEIVQRIARAHDAVFVDVQAAFDAVLAHRHPCRWHGIAFIPAPPAT